MKPEDDGINTLTFRVTYRDSLSPSKSPYRLLDAQGQEVDWANDFLDLQQVRGLSSYTLRAYAFSLLHCARWWVRPIPQPLSELNESTLFQYVCHQRRTEPQPQPPTINHRLTVLRGLYRFHFQTDIPKGRHNLGHTYATRSPLGYGRPQRATSAFRVKQTSPVTIPLSAEEVAQFWRTFRSFRDLSIVALMLLDGPLGLAGFRVVLSGGGVVLAVLMVSPLRIPKLTGRWSVALIILALALAAAHAARLIA